MSAPFSAITLTTLPFTRQSMDWSRIACHAVNTVLRAVDVFNRMAPPPECQIFSLHRIQENGFLFRLSSTASGAETFKLYLLKLSESIGEGGADLALDLVELDRDGAVLARDTLHQTLYELIGEVAKAELLPEYATWKMAQLTSAHPLVASSPSLH